MAVRFAVLGELEVHDDRGPVRLPAGKVRSVLATLLLNAGEGVAVDELVERVWGDDEGSTAALHTCVLRLRRALGEHRDLVHTLSNGYLVQLTPDQLDLTRFEALVTAASSTTDPAAQAAHLRSALGLWRGTPLRGVPSVSLRRDVVPALVERRLAVLERCFEVELGLGRHAELIGELREVVDEHPLRERLTGMLVLALHRSGRRAEALAAYRAISERLADEHGLDPGPELRRIHDQVSAEKEAPRVVPSQLPADVIGFVGRAEEIGRLENFRVAAISGPPGTGKTALAVHVAHRLRRQFPDGQLYLNLRGYSPQPTVQPADAITRFLRALGVAPEAIPRDEAEQADLYRALLAGRRLLVVLDNAASAAQVEPLLPNAPGCAVLVTSRDTLHDLDALPVELGVFTPSEALRLLDQFVDVGIERTAAEDLADACAHLPLALRIAGARIADGDIAHYLDELRAESRLAALEVDGDEENAVRAAFALSYETLTTGERRLFRLLGHAPGADFTVETASVLLGSDAAKPLHRLATANLLQHQHGRYAFHDLLREFAAQRCAEEDPDRADVTRGLGEWYLATTGNATNLLNLIQHRTTWPDDTVPGRAFDDATAALAWLFAELGNLVATATAPGAGSLGWRLADALRGYLMNTHRQREWADVAEAGLAAARAARDDQAEAVMHNSLGALRWHQYRLREALAHFVPAAERLRALGPSDGLAAALHNIGIAHIRLGDADLGVRHLTDSLEVCRAAGARLREGNTLSSLGLACVESGRLAEAADHLLAGLAIGRELGNDNLVAGCLGSLCHTRRAQGDTAAAHQLIRQVEELLPRITSRNTEYVVLDELCALDEADGRYEQSLAHAEHGLALARARSDQRFEGRFLNALGLALRRLGQPEKAVDLHTKALAVFAGSYEFTAHIESLLGRAEALHELGEDAAPDCAEALGVIERTGLRLHEQRALAAQRKAACRPANKPCHTTETGPRDKSRDPVRP